MPSTSILKQIQHFLNDPDQSSLEMCFAFLETHTYHHGRLVGRLTKTNCRVIMAEHPDSTLAKMTVLDGPVFSFGFGFEKTVVSLGHKAEMLHLPKPFTQGTLQMDAEQLILSFTIDAPDPELKVRVKHIYSGLQTLEESSF